MYRDGVGGPSLVEKCMSYEVKVIVETIQELIPNYQPRIMYALIDKLSGHRLFMKSNGDVSNPVAGTVVDSSLVENQGDKEFDFYMVPHRATVATAMPVHFSVVYNTFDLPKREIETFTYHLCYGYFNWVGPIKVPAACMYAKKIAEFSHDNGVEQIHPDLLCSIHYI